MNWFRVWPTTCFLLGRPERVIQNDESHIESNRLSTRGYQIPLIENLGVLKDVNDAIDFTDNDIRYLGNFPRMLRLETLLCARNRISSIASELGDVLPNLKNLVLAQNHIQELANLDPLAKCTRLEQLCCLDNPVTQKQYYRLYLVWRIPSLRIIDYERVRRNERLRAEELFGTLEHPTEVATSIMGVKSRMFDLGTILQQAQGPATGEVVTGYMLTEEEREKIKQTIKNATSIAEINKLEAMLLEGNIPK
ncbi:U2 snRNP-associated protein Lea1 [Schizosaccharomyces japonicus yFS275]|uniref:U2 small nuclear ribonucleoprotein A' n=1 Tax=Schizosaccharomyces japonicus (strain yFS275 / FY16936) TaxID=402676 RepID=B6K3M0_SCHJY|nr:U2 snRNP-associated protein Lea1 [Schizosaccharomyces japonicus yFS275]EEB08077.1 U2 snRNP-associated protein Lea1 [Schizosaccharomyces japonicus yFS275]